MKKLMIIGAGAVGTAAVSMAFFGSGIAAADDYAGQTYEVQLRVTITPEFLGEAQAMARQQRMEIRQGILARVLAAAMALLLVLGGYLRLEEVPRGYYTRALRLAAVGLLAVVGVGLWLLR